VTSQFDWPSEGGSIPVGIAHRLEPRLGRKTQLHLQSTIAARVGVNPAVPQAGG
jgi:hypothetical protein